MPRLMPSVQVSLAKRLASAVCLVCVLGLSTVVWGQEDAPKAEAAASGETKSAEPAPPAADAKAAEAKKEDEHAADAKGSHDEHAAHDDHSGHHHDPMNLTEANGSATLHTVADPKFQDSIASLVIFGLLMAVLIKFAWGPITQGLDAREHGIAEKIEQARLGAEKAAKQLQEYEAKLAVATEEARGIVAQARVDAETTRDKIIAEGKAVSQQERDRAIADIHAAKSQALSEIARKSVDAAIGLASKIVKREVKPADHEQLIGEAISQFSKSGLN